MWSKDHIFDTMAGVVTMKLFGSASRSKVLTLVGLLGATYPRELARLSGVPLPSVQRIVNDLEREGAVVSRIVGANREVRLNPRFYGAGELRSLLIKYAKRDPNLEQTVSELRRRPRRAGKAL
jgi:DNA-binding IclR family transcriptional regulator